MSFEWLEKKKDEVEADYKIGKISEEEYQYMLDAIENKKKTTVYGKIKRTIKVIKTLRGNSDEIKNVEESYKKGLISKAEYNHYLRMNKPFMSKKKVGLLTYIFFGFGILLFFFYWFVYLPDKTYIEVDDFSKMGDPIQIPVTGSITKFVEGQNIKIDYLAEYTLSGRVIATAQYGANLIEKLLGSLYLTDNSIRYRDVGIGWGFLTMDDYVDRFSWSSLSRFLVPKPKSQADWFYVTEKHSWEEISTHFSHNHLIPVDDNVKRLLRGIKRGNYVQIKGYLVSLTGDKGYNLKSSLVRDDSGDGACETILVTDVKWLKEKKK